MVRINGLFHLLINGVYWGCNLLTNLLQTSWDIQVGELPSIPVDIQKNSLDLRLLGAFEKVTNKNILPKMVVSLMVMNPMVQTK